MATSVHDCPGDRAEMADLLSLHRLSQWDAAAFRAHCRICSRCAEELSNTQLIIEGLRTIESDARPSAMVYRYIPGYRPEEVCR